MTEVMNQLQERFDQSLRLSRSLINRECRIDDLFKQVERDNSYVWWYMDLQEYWTWIPTGHCPRYIHGQTIKNAVKDRRRLLNIAKGFGEGHTHFLTHRDKIPAEYLGQYDTVLKKTYDAEGLAHTLADICENTRRSERLVYNYFWPRQQKNPTPDQKS